MKVCAFIIAVFLILYNLQAQSINIKKVAIEGYDVVAYHKGQAIEGTNRLSVKIRDVFYHFSSIENKALFKKNPKKYLPKYGGFCAIGIAIYDGKYNIDPEDFLIDNGELYLFCPDQIDNWIADQENLKRKAEIEWLKMEEKETKK
ncbi:hypothetical protein D1816_20165 [Aquimarina sp. AD10]|uniref:YHS domain-containing (seleno)protein n=1 Tax=Aquimarina sp. AD10 TaxID=1714849 RepID=UPI000E4CEAFF|nr:YHS domain-containing (seleno)protein [Aquimarina sp. AD10]AXT62575.1 hypothetical protein D1816_20165 [Aquimarina sp. AD10]RKM97760.1 hypothetical protein D7033_13480 [Aquimarina sp. AD10]